MSSSLVAGADRYIYQPLLPERKQIRLIHLKRISKQDDGLRNTPVECTMEMFDLGDAPPFTALSYVWGPPEPKRRIFIDSQIFTVRINLFQFLQEFRRMPPDPDVNSKPGDDDWLWIDQMSIDQSNRSERGHQVKMMKDVYSTASSVIAWLGDGSRPVNWKPDGTAKNEYQAALAYEANPPHRNILEEILINTYFSRLWIVQEVLLATKIRFLLRDL